MALSPAEHQKLSIVKTRPFSQVTIILLPNMPTVIVEGNRAVVRVRAAAVYSGPSRKQREGAIRMAWP